MELVPAIPSDLMLGNLGQYRGMAGMWASRTVMDQDSVWFEGTDGSHPFASVRLGREWLKRDLSQSS